MTGKDTPKGQWSEVDLPDAKVKIETIAVDNTGSFCILITDKGVVYFGGVNKKGEAGENGMIMIYDEAYYMNMYMYIIGWDIWACN